MGREGSSKQITLTCARSVSATLGLPSSQRVCPPCPHCSGSRLLHRELSKASPGLHAPPRSKPLRFMHSGSPQRHRLSWACVFCPSQIQAAQVTRCLASAVAQITTSPIPAAQFSGCTTGTPSQADVDCPESQEVLVSNKPACSLVDNASLGPQLPPSGSGCPRLPVSGGGWASLQLAGSAQSFVL